MGIKFIIKQWLKMFMQSVMLPFVYWLHRWRKIDHNLIVFADAHHSQRPESMHLLFDAVLASGMRVEEYYVDYGKLNPVKLFVSMASFMKLYATAGCVVICDNFVPVTACNKKKETKVIQLWHGAGAFKKFGYDATEDIPSYYKGLVYRNYDLVTVSGEFCVAPFMSAMRLPENVVKPVGISRMDRYFDESYISSCRDAFYAIHPEAKGKKILLWAPTFRGNAANPTLLGLESLERLEAQLGEDWYVVYSVHPHIMAHIKHAKFETELSTEAMISVADVFMTDFSSVMYDAALLGKAMLLFATDFDEFMETRGCYMDIQEFPGHIVTAEEALLPAVLDTIEHYDYAQLETFRKNYMGACDGLATQRILNYIRT